MWPTLCLSATPRDFSTVKRRHSAKFGFHIVSRRLQGGVESLFEPVIAVFERISAVFQILEDRMKRETVQSEKDEFSEEKIGDVIYSLKVQWALQEVMQMGVNNDQLVYGVHNAANELAIDQGNIGLCVLVENPTADPGIQVHCRLIGAYCWECAIPVIKVNSSKKLCQMSRYCGQHREPLHCVLVKNIEEEAQCVSTLLKFARHIPAAILKIT